MGRNLRDFCCDPFKSHTRRIYSYLQVVPAFFRLLTLNAGRGMNGGVVGISISSRLMTPGRDVHKNIAPVAAGTCVVPVATDEAWAAMVGGSAVRAYAHTHTICGRAIVATWLPHGNHVETIAHSQITYVHVPKSQMCMCACSQIAHVHVRKSQMCMCARPQIVDVHVMTATTYRAIVSPFSTLMVTHGHPSLHS